MPATTSPSARTTTSKRQRMLNSMMRSSTWSVLLAEFFGLLSRFDLDCAFRHDWIADPQPVKDFGQRARGSAKFHHSRFELRRRSAHEHNSFVLDSLNG